MSLTSLNKLLDHFRSLATSSNEQGALFEHLMVAYFRTDPQYQSLLAQIWLWEDWPDRPDSMEGIDTGIDLIAQEKATGDYWAIQCQFFDSQYKVSKSDIDAFLAASGKPFTTKRQHSFVRRVIISTTDKWTRTAEQAIESQGIPVSRISLHDLGHSPIAWEHYHPDHRKLPCRAKKTLYPHQQDAIEAVIKGFKTHKCGKMIMACGTGKTLTSLRLAERIIPAQGWVLFLSPSISLIAQTLREWTAEAEDPIRTFAVCSDPQIGRNKDDIRLHDLAYPATTHADRLIRAIHADTTLGCPDYAGRPDYSWNVIFSTYQSIHVIAEAQKAGLPDAGLPDVDLIICDEAHRTTGLTEHGQDLSYFHQVHDNKSIRAHRRLYMTATPRIYTEASKTKASEENATLYSMDSDIFGPEFYRLRFDQAIEQSLLSDYRVLIVTVDQSKMGAIANRYNKIYQLDENQAINIHFATKIIGCWKGLSKQDLIDEHKLKATIEDPQPMRRAVAFSQTIKKSKRIVETFNQLIALYAEYSPYSPMVSCDLRHIDGKMNALERIELLNWLKGEADFCCPGEGSARSPHTQGAQTQGDLPGSARPCQEPPSQPKCHILSNARCLSEGIDVPALDAVIFFDARESIIDIVQAIGRVMRKTPGKDYGYIILPICMPLTKRTNYHAYIEQDEQFKGIWKVLKALRAHDESLIDEATFRHKIKQVLIIDEEPDTSPAPNKEPASLSSAEKGYPPQLVFPLDDLNEAIYAAIPKKLGDRDYWRHWAGEIGGIANRLTNRIYELIKQPQARQAFDQFLTGLRDNLTMQDDQAIEMLAQHIITGPVFEALFQDYSFMRENPVSKAMQQITQQISRHGLNSERDDKLTGFYTYAQDRVALAKSDKSKQEIIRSLYSDFFQTAFPDASRRLGIVYTPVEVVDFILHSLEHIMREEFGSSLGAAGVHILDPFAGTGTFISRLLQSDLLSPEQIRRKWKQGEIHANEIVLLAYYIACINIEAAYHERAPGPYQPFTGMALADSFQMQDDRDLVDRIILPENSARLSEQNQQAIHVIMGNPPYLAKKSTAYPRLDNAIEQHYARTSSVANKNALYDDYIRALRWAQERIGKRGIIGFITNAGWIDKAVCAGMRKDMASSFDSIAIINLRGDIRKNRLSYGKAREGENIFGQGSQTGIAITLLVKTGQKKGATPIRYADIGDDLTRKAKLSKLDAYQSIRGAPFEIIQPDAYGDWINQRLPDQGWEISPALGARRSQPLATTALFNVYSCGVSTSRDAWCYHVSRSKLAHNIQSLITYYHEACHAYHQASHSGKIQPAESFMNEHYHDLKKIKWARGLLKQAARGRSLEFSANKIITSLYRPFTRRYLYFCPALNEMIYQLPRFFSAAQPRNRSLCISGLGSRSGFSVLMAEYMPNLSCCEATQCFPLYRLDDSSEAGRVLNLSQTAIDQFRSHYTHEAISHEDIFYYIYGLLHSPDYRQRFAQHLIKEMPRIPLVRRKSDFITFSASGRQLADLHVNYEQVQPYAVSFKQGDPGLIDITNPVSFYRVEKMKFAQHSKKKDRSTVIYNPNITLQGIPPEAYHYEVSGRPALEWVMDQQSIKNDKASGITKDANDWASETMKDPAYPLKLFQRVITVSLETMKIINALPDID